MKTVPLKTVINHRSMILIGTKEPFNKLQTGGGGLLKNYCINRFCRTFRVKRSEPSMRRTELVKLLPLSDPQKYRHNLHVQ